MKALQFDRIGSLDALKQIELPMPRPGTEEALIKIHAAGLNPSDVKNVLGRFPYTTLPRVPGRDFAGTVMEGPAGWIGKQVWGTGRDLGFFRDGSHAEYLVLPISSLSEKPESLTFAQAASCGVPFTTALDALDRTGVTEGTRLLIIGAAGAVGNAALQMARVRGANVVAAVRRAEQADALSASAVQVLRLDGASNLADSVKAYFPQGADVIFDTTGFWLAASVEALAPFGRIAVIAAPSDGQVDVPVLQLYRRGGSIVGINSLLYDSTACAAMLTRLVRHFDSGHLRAADLQTFAFERGLDAYVLATRAATPKIVLEML